MVSGYVEEAFLFVNEKPGSLQIVPRFEEPSRDQLSFSVVHLARYLLVARRWQENKPPSDPYPIHSG